MAWQSGGTQEFSGEKFQVEGVTDRDRELAEDALAVAAKIMLEKKPHLLVLDEVNLGAYWKLLDVGKVLELLNIVPKETTVVMTGSYAPQELIDRADFVNVVQHVKMPNSFKATEGIQY